MTEHNNNNNNNLHSFKLKWSGKNHNDGDDFCEQGGYPNGPGYPHDRLFAKD